MVHAPPREGGAVLDGIPSGNGHLSVTEHLCPRPSAQLRPFHGTWVPPRQLPTRALQIPRAAPSVLFMPSAAVEPVGLAIIRPEEGNTQIGPQETPVERVALRGDMENH